MAEKQNKKLSRRDAIKLLGAAAGAAALATCLQNGASLNW